MALTDEEKAQLEALTRKSQEPDPAEDFEIEIFDGTRGARIPYSKGRSFLQQHFGIDLSDPSADDAGSKKDKPDTKSKTKPDEGTDNDSGNSRPTVLRHLGQQRNAS